MLLFYIGLRLRQRPSGPFLTILIVVIFKLFNPTPPRPPLLTSANFFLFLGEFWRGGRAAGAKCASIDYSMFTFRCHSFGKSQRGGQFAETRGDMQFQPIQANPMRPPELQRTSCSRHQSSYQVCFIYYFKKEAAKV